MLISFYIDANIRKAKTIHTEFYIKSEFYEAAKEKIFAITWQFVTAKTSLEAQNVQPPPVNLSVNCKAIALKFVNK